MTNRTNLFLTFILLLLPTIALAMEEEPIQLFFWDAKKDYFHPVDFSQPAGSRIPTGRGFKPESKTVVLVHGFAETIHREMYREFARRVKQREPDTNILGLDWSGAQNNFLWSDPVIASAALPDVADWAYDKLVSHKDGLGLDAWRIHLVGFSHGAHVAALIGKKTCGNIAHLTLLDPSPGKSHLLSMDNFLGRGWNAQDSAKYVDMYKSSKFAATHSCRGDVSYRVYENGIEPTERNLEELYRNHYYAFHWYLATVNKSYTDFGYSIVIPEKRPPISPNWTGTINSTLPKRNQYPKKGETNGYTGQDYDNERSTKK